MMDKSEALRVAASAASVSDKIRALDAAGYPRAEIAKLLGKRYQHVRNVLEGDKTRRASLAAYVGVEEPAAAFGGVSHLLVGRDGSVTLPASVLAALGTPPGGVLLAEIEEGRVVLLSADTAWRRVQELAAPHRAFEGSASQELIAERRAGAVWDD